MEVDDESQSQIQVTQQQVQYQKNQSDQSRLTNETVIRIKKQRLNRRLFTDKRGNDDKGDQECKRFKES